MLSFVGDCPCVLSKKSVLDQLSSRVDPIQDRIGVPVVSSGKNSHLKMLIHELKALSEVGSHEKARHEWLTILIRRAHFDLFIDGPIAVVISEKQGKLSILYFILVSFGVYQSLIKVKNEQPRKTWLRKFELNHVLRLQGRNLSCLLYDGQRLENTYS